MDGWLSGLKRIPAKNVCDIASRVQIPDHPYKPKTICIHGLRPVNRGHATDGFCLVGCSVITSLGGLANPLYIYRQTCTTF